jgi:putative acetyltransferase
MVIRERRSADDDAIRHLNDVAFGDTDESELIEDLRAAGLVAVELVAEDQQLNGHILFSALDVTIARKPVRALALAPMAVQPHRQRRGIGSALVRAGLQRARQGGWQAVVVLGHQDYYPRFGFSAGLAQPLEGPFSGASFMALELEPGTLQGGTGRVVYPAAFGV